MSIAPDPTEGEKHAVMVGGSEVRVNESEWLVATASKGTRLRVTPGQRSQKQTKPYDMVLQGSYFYDGVVAWGYLVDPDDYIKMTAYPGLGDEVEIL
jgi:hypothetical protein